MDLLFGKCTCPTFSKQTQKMATTADLIIDQEQERIQTLSQNEDGPVDPTIHSNWRIALYYIYFDLATDENVREQIDFHLHLCQQFHLKGRVRISKEGINGVLSGLHCSLTEYERLVTTNLEQLQLQQRQRHQSAISNDNGIEDNVNVVHSDTSINLDVKYCLLREDLPIQPQLFDTCTVKETKAVISLFDDEPVLAGSTTHNNSNNKHSKQSNRRRRRKEQKQQQKKSHQQQQLEEHTLTLNPDSAAATTTTALPSTAAIDLSKIKNEMMEYTPSRHLTAEEWNAKLQQAQNGSNDYHHSSKALLMDVRNVYESRVGRFSVPNVPTLLTNTRKYSDLPHLLATNPHVQEKEEIFMYCTGGVRCERVSMLVQALYPQKKVYQLQGGIQTYLRETTATATPQHMDDTAHSTSDTTTTNTTTQTCLFQGKNFVFDPRRTDPVHSGTIIGKCLVCQTPHDDYDNGHAPSDNKEARCNLCRMLILVCNQCRPGYVCFGETTNMSSKCVDQTVEERPLLYCGLHKCIHEGAAPEPELVVDKEVEP